MIQNSPPLIPHHVPLSLTSVILLLSFFYFILFCPMSSFPETYSLIRPPIHFLALPSYPPLSLSPHPGLLSHITSRFPSTTFFILFPSHLKHHSQIPQQQSFPSYLIFLPSSLSPYLSNLIPFTPCLFLHIFPHPFQLIPLVIYISSHTSPSSLSLHLSPLISLTSPFILVLLSSSLSPDTFSFLSPHQLLEKFLSMLCPSAAPPKPLHGIVHHIDTGSTAPVFTRSQMLDPKKHSIAEEEFLALEKAGIIRCSNLPWAAPLHLVPKKDG
jgi:hypothetical protein